jgi:hypothetical protein
MATANAKQELFCKWVYEIYVVACVIKKRNLLLNNKTRIQYKKLYHIKNTHRLIFSE